MDETFIARGSIRKVWAAEREKLREHLLRLDPPSRRLRFGHAVPDDFISSYAQSTDFGECLVWGYHLDGCIRAVAELRRLSDSWGTDAEAAFSVETPWQDHGLGSELMGRVIRAARNRGVEHLYMSCLAENARMQRIARKHEARLRFEYGEVVGEIVPADSTYASVFAEAVEDRIGYMLAVLDLQKQVINRLGNRAA